MIVKKLIPARIDKIIQALHKAFPDYLREEDGAYPARIYAGDFVISKIQSINAASCWGNDIRHINHSRKKLYPSITIFIDAMVKNSTEEERSDLVHLVVDAMSVSSPEKVEEGGYYGGWTKLRYYRISLSSIMDIIQDYADNKD